MRRGLSHNPFSSVHVSPERGQYVFVEADGLEKLTSQLAEGGWTAQLVGCNGAGKSTLLYTLLGQAERVGHRCVFWRCSDERKRLPWTWRVALALRRRRGTAAVKAVRTRTIVFLDGAELVSASELQALAGVCRGRSMGLIITAHRTLELEGSAVLKIEPEPRAFQEFVQKLFSREEGFAREVAQTVPVRLVANSGNARQVLLDLYDEFEDRGRSSSAVRDVMRTDVRS